MCQCFVMRVCACVAWSVWRVLLNTAAERDGYKSETAQVGSEDFEETAPTKIYGVAGQEAGNEQVNKSASETAELHEELSCSVAEGRGQKKSGGAKSRGE